LGCLGVFEAQAAANAIFIGTFPRMTTADRAERTNLKGHIPELDGLRGVAIGLVIIWHYLPSLVHVRPGTTASYLIATTRLSWTGVDLFFVLSGFLIGGILLDARKATNYFRVFYTRRFFRIVPIYVAVLLIFPAISILQNARHPGLAPAVVGSNPPWYMYWTFTQNFWMAVASTLGTNNLRMTWSLAVEEQFYLTLPLIVFFFSGRQLRKVALCGIVAAPLLRVFLYVLWPNNWGAPFTLMPCRADSLLLGVLAAILLRDATWREKIQNARTFFAAAVPVFLAGIGFLVWRCAGPECPLMVTIGYSWMGCFYVTVLLFAVTRPGSLLGRALRIDSLRWLGSIAYGTYLLHQGILNLALQLCSINQPTTTNAGSFLVTCVALVLTLVAARLSWNFFEKPLVKIGHRTDYQFDNNSLGGSLGSFISTRSTPV
jgi:peptidoglycan/LPS O-acetylase OafA/YrhL